MNEGGPVLIFSSGRRDRSALVAYAVLLRVGYTLTEATQLLRLARAEATLSRQQMASIAAYAALHGPR
jgi:hypothetical protein